MNVLRRLDPFIPLVLLLSVFAVAPLTAPGFFLNAHDATIGVYFLWQFDAGIRDGAWWPVWGAHMVYGYGYPLFMLIAPLAYYVAEGFLLLGAGHGGGDQGRLRPGLPGQRRHHVPLRPAQAGPLRGPGGGRGLRLHPLPHRGHLRPRRPARVHGHGLLPGRAVGAGLLDVRCHPPPAHRGNRRHRPGLRRPGAHPLHHGRHLQPRGGGLRPLAGPLPRRGGPRRPAGRWSAGWRRRPPPWRWAWRSPPSSCCPPWPSCAT